MAEQREPVPLSRERYEELAAVRARSRRSRMEAVEEFRIWASLLHPEVKTVDDALRACTPEELYRAAVEIPPIELLAASTVSLSYAALLRLEERAETARRERAKAAAVALIMPGEEVGDGE